MSFAPNDRPRVAVAADGTVAAIHESTRVSVVEIPSCTAFAELGTDADAVACEVAWVGTPPRLLVLSRYQGHSTVHLVDPFGPRTISEIRLEAPMRLYAAVGSHALAIGSNGAAVLAATDKTLTAHQFPARSVPLAAGAAGTQFLVALPGAIEEWDPQSRMPKRRLKLPRPAAITAVGGSDRVVWMTTQQDPHRIEVIPLVNRGQPKVHDLPEPIASVSSHPRSDLIACIGATSGRVWVIDLDGRVGLRMVGPEGIDRAEAVGIVLGRVAGVLAAQAQHPIIVVPLERPDGEGDGARPKSGSSPPADKRSTLYGDAEDDRHRDEAPTSVTLGLPGGELPITAAPPRPPSRAPLPQFGSPVPEATAAAPRTAAAASSATQSAGLEPHASAQRRTSTEPPPLAPRESRRDLGTLATEPPPLARADARHSDSEDASGFERGSDGISAHRVQHVRRSDALGPSGAQAAGDPAGARSVPPHVSSAEPAPPASRDSRRDLGTLATQAPPFAGGDQRSRAFAAWRERVAVPRARTAEPVMSPWSDARPSWRGELVMWTNIGDRSAFPASTPVEAIVQRYELSPQLEAVVGYMYAQHLLGKEGTAPSDIAALLDAVWDEALGRGELASHGIASLRGSRVHLSDVVLRVLDEQPPQTGTLVGAPGVVSLLGPCVIVSHGPLPIIAEACLASIGGAILAANADVDPAELAAEARPYGAAPMWRVRIDQLTRVPAEHPFILVADDDGTADQLGVPRLS